MIMSDTKCQLLMIAYNWYYFPVIILFTCWLTLIHIQLVTTVYLPTGFSFLAFLPRIENWNVALMYSSWQLKRTKNSDT